MESTGLTVSIAGESISSSQMRTSREFLEGALVSGPITSFISIFILRTSSESSQHTTGNNRYAGHGQQCCQDSICGFSGQERKNFVNLARPNAKTLVSADLPKPALLLNRVVLSCWVARSLDRRRSTRRTRCRPLALR